ncbi:hypothetical protein Sjap_024614 [Stephania japonica]|uniref:Inositol polyphosphate-related phosphatase domain-containing protein n=1 Tax=Stephania japonica TaxID=461633 RepID=A0AAP0HNW3_9MAGN
MDDNKMIRDNADASVPPPRRKIQSYSQQLAFPISHRDPNRAHNARRKHSLEEARMPKNTDLFVDDDVDDQHFFITTTTTTTTAKNNNISNNNNKKDNVGGALVPIGSSRRHDQGQRSIGSTGTEGGLEEFVASGGGKGIFKVPYRSAVDPDRPPTLDLRPHPLRETQVGCFLRVVGCTDAQLWAGHEAGVRFWNFRDLYGVGIGASKGKEGEENAAPFSESDATSPALCIILDGASRLAWTGHKDGKIRSWKMEQSVRDGTAGFKEGLNWRAHRGPVLSMIMTSYGDLWSGSEGGSVKVWSWEAIEKTFFLSTDEKHMASLLVERSFVDLKSQVTVNGVCSISNSDVKFLLSDNSRAKIWSAGSQSFSLWDARSRELLKVFNVDGQIENRVDLSTAQDSGIEDEMKVKFVSSSKKEKSQGLSFFQRSRNALLGAADAVRRAATKGAFADDNKKTEAIALTVDGMIWTGCTNGSLVRWDGNGNRLQDFNHLSSAVQCLCTFGSRIWVGYMSGTVHVLNLEGNLLGGWNAHSSPVISMAVGDGYVFTLANQGGIRGWSITSPGPLDNILRTELSSKAHVYAKQENLKVLVGTWNVGQEKASHDSLIVWLGSVASDVGIVVVGLQEVEMGAGFLAMSAARETVGLEGSSVGQWWMDMIGKTLDEGTTFERVGSRQLAALLIVAWVRKNLRPHVGDVDAAAVPCGFGRAIGNKGAVGLRMRVYDRIFCFSNCHLAAHLEAVNRRNADFDHIYRTMTFNRPNLLNAAAGIIAAGIHSEEGKPELSEADMIVFLGDFNYRLYGITYEEAKDFVSQRCFDWLRVKDQLRAEMRAGKVFQGMREGVFTFPPTYKFQRNQAGLGGYDSSEKKRIPAWCDRILYRDNRSGTVSKCSLECPVVTSVLHYDACMEVTDSDHKPVRCIYSVEIAHIDESIKRHEFGEIVRSNEKIRSLLEETYYIPETRISVDKIVLLNHDKCFLQIMNKSDKENALFELFCEGQSTIGEDGEAYKQRPRGCFGFPRWLEVTPAAGMIKPGQMAEVSINHLEFHTLEEFVDGIPQNWWSEDTLDKEAFLVLCIRSSRSHTSRSQHIHVSHSFASKSIRASSRCSSAKRTQGTRSKS